MKKLIDPLSSAAQYAHSAKRESLPFLSDHAKPGTGLHQKFVHGLAAKDKEGMKAAAEKVAAWDFGQSLPRRLDQLCRGTYSTRSNTDSSDPCFYSTRTDRIIPCHGDVIETGGKKGASESRSRTG